MARHALVCGASGGIGRATAIALAQAGHTVTALARSADKLADLVEELKEAGAPQAFALVADLDRRRELAELVEGHLAHHGPIHILINNTGGPPSGKLLEVEDEDAFAVPFGRHVLAAHLLARLLVPGMQASAFGRIVNIVSTGGKEPIPNLGVSNTIRHAVLGWAKSLSKELPSGITINSVLPGYTDTQRLASLKRQLSASGDRTEADVEAGWIAQTPEGRLGRPEELAATIAFLCGDDAGFIRGQAIAVDGGRMAAT